jgi:hypothetical protein
MFLGICYHQNYEFVSTHGVPLTHYQDRFTANAFLPELFDQEMEIRDLQAEPLFAGMAVLPIAKSWRYCATVPVRMRTPLPDGGVLALSCADKALRSSMGKIPAILRAYAELIGDLIWLGAQVQRAVVSIDPAAVIQTVLRSGMAQLKLPVCIIDQDLNVIGQSQNFIDTISEMGWPISGNSQALNIKWLDSDLLDTVRAGLMGNQPVRLLPIGNDAGKRLFLDVFPLNFADVGGFAILSVHNGEHAFALLDAHKAYEVRDVATANAAWGDDGPGPVSRFLLATLIRGQRLHRCGDTSYISLRKWRNAVKPFQIDALRALKADVPESLVAAAAEEMVDAVKKIYGDPSSCVIVPVPCGSSGSNCLSCQIAGRMARVMGIPVVQAFLPIDVPRGSSHPRKNIKRPKMKLVENIKKPIILVDDVATSGSHINEAAMLLRTLSPQVWSLTWIAA